jgi:hypothetical protein
MYDPWITPARLMTPGAVPWPLPVPAPLTLNVMILCFDDACGHAVKARHVVKNNIRMLIFFIIPSMKEAGFELADQVSLRHPENYIALERRPWVSLLQRCRSLPRLVLWSGCQTWTLL